MNELFYLIVRCFIKNGAESHSIELKNDFDEAENRFYSIVDSDINNSQIKYLSAYVIRSNDGTTLFSKIKDRRTQEGA